MGVGRGVAEDACQAGEGDTQQRPEGCEERAWGAGPGESLGQRAGKGPRPAGPGLRDGGAEQRARAQGVGVCGEGQASVDWMGVSEKEGCQGDTQDWT